MSEDGPAPLAALSPGAAVAAAAALLVIAFPSSVAGLLRLAGGASPGALSAGVLVFAGVWAWLALRSRGEELPPAKRHEIALGLGTLAVVALVQWLAPRGPLGGPGRARPDLLTLPVFAGGLALAAFGARGLRRLAGPAALLILAWPPASALVSAPLSRPLLALTRWAGAGLARAFGVSVEAVPGLGGILVCSGRAGTQTIAVAPACSGTSGVVAVLIAAAPVVALATGSTRRKALWVLAGSGLVAAFAPVRVAILCRLAAERGAESAFRAFHVLGGTAFFVLAWVAMLALTKPFGLEPPPLAEMPGARVRPSGREGWMLLAGALVASLVSGAGNVRLHARPRATARPPAAGPGIVFRDEPALPLLMDDAMDGTVLEGPEPPAPEPVDDAPADDIVTREPPAEERPAPPPPPPGPEPFTPRRISTWVSRVEGYQRWRYRSMPWTRSVYGERSWLERIVYARPEGAFYWVDALILTEPARLDEHTVHGCYTWHGWTVESWDRREMAPGGAGERIVHVDGGGRRWVSVTWAERAAPEWWLRVNVQRRVREGEDAGALLREAWEFAPRLRRARAQEAEPDVEVEGPF